MSVELLQMDTVEPMVLNRCLESDHKEVFNIPICICDNSIKY